MPKKRSSRGLYAQRRNKGLCYHCGEPATVGRYCLDSWFANTAFNNLGSRIFAPVLKELWKLQKGKCSYTGTRLVPGENASLCRLQPPSKIGDEFQRLRTARRYICWTTKIVARMKSDLTHKEFLRVCKRIIEHAGSKS